MLFGRKTGATVQSCNFKQGNLTGIQSSICIATGDIKISPSDFRGSLNMQTLFSPSCSILQKKNQNDLIIQKPLKNKRKKEWVYKYFYPKYSRTTYSENWMLINSEQESTHNLSGSTSHFRSRGWYKVGLKNKITPLTFWRWMLKLKCLKIRTSIKKCNVIMLFCEKMETYSGIMLLFINCHCISKSDTKQFSIISLWMMLAEDQYSKACLSKKNYLVSKSIIRLI